MPPMKNAHAKVKKTQTPQRADLPSDDSETMPRWKLWAAGSSGALLLAAAFPPFNLGLVAWFALVPWLWLCLQEKLPGKRPYLSLWSIGFVFWLWLLQGIRLAHPLLIFGWLALSAYVAVYLPLFIGLTRKAVHEWKIPLVIAAPLIWAGLEVIRAHFLTGFALAQLSHTQVDFLPVIQIASLGGSYAVSFLLLLIQAALIDAHYRFWQDGRPYAAAWRLAATAGIASASLYWSYSTLLSQGLATGLSKDDQRLRVVLIQGSLDTVFEMSADTADRTLRHYAELTTEAKKKHPEFDLLVWPESSCPIPYLQVDPGYQPPRQFGMSAAEFAERAAASNKQLQNLLRDITAQAGAPVLLGSTVLKYGDDQQIHSYNAALWTDAKGEIQGQYHKMHPVMFGEYIPFADLLPFLYQITPMSGGLTPGKQAETLEVNGFRLAPSICFESTVPHLLSSQVADLNKRGEEPDVLVNITNDGWFWGSSILDHHLRCAIFRAVELRKPMLVAANTGFSVYVDGNGQIRQLGPRREPAILFTEVRRDGRTAGAGLEILGWLFSVLPLALLLHPIYRWGRGLLVPTRDLPRTP